MMRAGFRCDLIDFAMPISIYGKRSVRGAGFPPQMCGSDSKWYAARVTRKPTVAIVGAGSLATSLTLALKEAGYRVSEIVSRRSPGSQRRARRLAARIGARAVTVSAANLDASLLWFCVPDREIRAAASSASAAGWHGIRIAFHSSGALPSRELDPLRKRGVAVAAVHPLMTFVPGAKPSLAGVPFAVEGDTAATRLARRIVRDLRSESFALSAFHKPAYHAWATFTSPLLLAFLVSVEEAARAAGLSRADSRRMSLPIIRQTLANYTRLGPEDSFSGPIIRGDVETVAGHLAALKKVPATREVYIALARSAIRRLPAKNQGELRRLLRSSNQ
jgi:predicted short-subunit dehydrogenase-like oxidoreductase (DUF2520 family)